MGVRICKLPLRLKGLIGPIIGFRTFGLRAFSRVVEQALLKGSPKPQDPTTLNLKPNL